MTMTTPSLISVEDLKSMSMGDISELVKNTESNCKKKVEEINVYRSNMDAILTYVKSISQK